MASDFDENKDWADRHWADIERVLREVGSQHMEVGASSFEKDTRDAIDYEVALPETRVACRVRRVASCGDLRQLTIGSSSRGPMSEAMKLATGTVDWYLYAWSDGVRFVEWMVVDMARVVAEGLMDRAMREGHEVTTRGGRFLHISTDILKGVGAIVDASWMP